MTKLISLDAAIAALSPMLRGISRSHACNILRALPAAPAVKVKPLVWRRSGVEFVSNSPFGVYLFAYVDTDHGRQWAFWQPDSDTDDVDAATGFAPTIEAAKAAAQADYEARILSALEGGEA